MTFTDHLHSLPDNCRDWFLSFADPRRTDSCREFAAALAHVFHGNRRAIDEDFTRGIYNRYCQLQGQLRIPCSGIPRIPESVPEPDPPRVPAPAPHEPVMEWYNTPVFEPAAYTGQLHWRPGSLSQTRINELYQSLTNQPYTHEQPHIRAHYHVGPHPDMPDHRHHQQ